MKIRIVIAVLLILVMAPFSSYALDNEAGIIIPAKILLKYNIGDKNWLVSQEKADNVYSLNYNDIKEVRFDFNNEKENIYRGYLEWSDSQNAVRPLIYDISVVSHNKEFKSSTFDLRLPSTIGDVVQIGAAFLTNLVMHEFGHAVVADYVGATGSRLDFFKKEGNQFFLGTSTVEEIDEKSRLPYTMGGEFFADLTFEHALQNYRKNPSMFNKSLLFTSGTDFLWYCFYAFYLSEGHPYFDPVTISEETGISKNTLLSVVLAKTLVNAYRVYTGQDRVIPIFTVDRYSAALNFIIPF